MTYMPNRTPVTLNCCQKMYFQNSPKIIQFKKKYVCNFPLNNVITNNLITHILDKLI